MHDYSDDIFTEQSDIDVDTLANLGPLRALAGVWEGAKSLDVNPNPGEEGRLPFHERIELQPIDPQSNGPQFFYGLRYHIHINTREEDITFHDQVGYWLWEPKTGLIMQTVAIPRGQVLLASGHAKPHDKTISVSAERGDTLYGICSTAFLDAAFRTQSYRCDITFNDDGTWTYLIQTALLLKGKEPFNHHDTNTLTLVRAPAPNPWAVIEKERGAR